jgi:hypothetical protein
MSTPTTQRILSRQELGFIIGVPVAWGILLLFHPLGGDGFYEVIDGNVAAWITVHIGMGIFVPLFAGAIYLLLQGVEERPRPSAGSGSRCSRCSTPRGSSCSEWAPGSSPRR